LNWAGKNYIPSMKPQEKSAATNLAFGAKSTYMGDFDGKKGTKTPIHIR
jgi:hypothetical protein